MPIIVIETPKWNMQKFDYIPSCTCGSCYNPPRFRRVYYSPIPIPFNYGCMPNSIGEDGMPQDIIVVGHKMKQGTEILLGLIGEVEFEDNGEKDTKYIASNDGERHELRIHLFFKIYEKAKFFIGLLTGKGFTKSSYKGIKWY